MKHWIAFLLVLGLVSACDSGEKKAAKAEVKPGDMPAIATTPKEPVTKTAEPPIATPTDTTKTATPPPEPMPPPAT